MQPPLANVLQPLINVFEAILKFLKLIPEGVALKAEVDKLLDQEVIGFYDPPTKRLFVAGETDGSRVVVTRLFLLLVDPLGEGLLVARRATVGTGVGERLREGLVDGDRSGRGAGGR